MSDPVALGLDRLPCGAVRARVTLQAPRANALEPALLAALDATLDRAEEAGASVILLTSAGRNFCSGGDVARFAQAVAAGQGAQQARQTVPRLQALVLRLLSVPALVALAGRGAITGGGAGFLFASDIAVLSPDAFLQPYYTIVGFAPDGGWSAILPEVIGPRAALSVQLENRRFSAGDCVGLGLAAATDPHPEARIETLVDPLNIEAALAAKRLVWNPQRLTDVKTRLEAETQAFLARIDQPDTAHGMARFLQGLTHA